MASIGYSASSPHSSVSSFNTSSPPILTPQVDTLVIFPPIVLFTPLTFLPRLSITTQLTRPAYNFTIHNYTAWASGFELFLESHKLHPHLTNDPPPLRNPSNASRLQSDSTIITWMLYNIEHSIVETLSLANPRDNICQTNEY